MKKKTVSNTKLTKTNICDDSKGNLGQDEETSRRQQETLRQTISIVYLWTVSNKSRFRFTGTNWFSHQNKLRELKPGNWLTKTVTAQSNQLQFVFPSCHSRSGFRDQKCQHTHTDTQTQHPEQVIDAKLYKRINKWLTCSSFHQSLQRSPHHRIQQ